MVERLTTQLGSAVLSLNSVPGTIRWGFEEGRRWIAEEDPPRLWARPQHFNGHALSATVRFVEAKLGQVEYETGERDGAAFCVGVMLAILEREINEVNRKRANGRDRG